MNAQEEIINRIDNLFLKIMVGMDYGTSGDKTVMTSWEDPQRIESIILADMDFRIGISIFQKEIARKKMQRKLLFGLIQFVRWTLTVWWWQSTKTLKKLWK